MKHCAPKHLLVHKDGALKTMVILCLKLLAKLLTILYQLTKLEAPSITSNLLDIQITSFQWPNLQRAITGKKKLYF